MEFLNKNNTALVLIDVQEKLFPHIAEHELLLENLTKMIKGAKVLDIPIIVTEQYRKGLGPTLPQLTALLDDYNPLEKNSFSCCGEKSFTEELAKLDRNQLLVCGIETHICVYQTCRELDNSGYYVHLVTDCVSSRDLKNKKIAINKLHNERNIFITSSEMALFEILKFAGSEEFKEISKIIK
ncbi:MAG: hydrolase [Fidelibacterota bacterium]